MKLHQTLILLFAMSFLALAVGCEEWRNAGSQHPNSMTPEESGMTQSQWQNTGGSPSTQPSK